MAYFHINRCEMLMFLRVLLIFQWPPVKYLFPLREPQRRYFVLIGECWTQLFSAARWEIQTLKPNLHRKLWSRTPGLTPGLRGPGSPLRNRSALPTSCPRGPPTKIKVNQRTSLNGILSLTADYKMLLKQIWCKLAFRLIFRILFCAAFARWWGCQRRQQHGISSFKSLNALLCHRVHSDFHPKTSKRGIKCVFRLSCKAILSDSVDLSDEWVVVRDNFLFLSSNSSY